MKKTLPSNLLYKLLLPTVSVILSLSANPAQAVTDLFWDNNGTSTPSSGTWDTSTANWAPTSALTASPGIFTSGAFAEFAAGTGTIPSLTITVPGTVTAAGITTAATSGASVTSTTFSGAGTIALSTGVQGLICPTGGSMAFNLPLSGAGGIEAEVGTVTLSAANSYAGTTEVGLGGTLQLGAANVIPNGTGKGNLSALSTGKFDLGGYNCAINGFGSSSVGIIDCTTGTGTLTIGYSGSSGTTTHAGIIQNTSPGVLSITVDNCPTGATTAFTGTNTYSGITTINNGLLQITNDFNLGAVPATPVANSITLNQSVSMTGVNYGLRLQNTAAVTLNANRGIYLGANGGNLECQSGKTLTVNGPISGPGPLWAGGGTSGAGIGGVVLNNTGNSYSGGTYINGGNLQLGANNTLPAGTPLWMGTSSSGGGTYFYMNSHSQTIGPLTGINGASGPQIQLTGALTILETNVSTTFTGVILSAGGSLTISTAAGGTPGTLTLTNVNTYSGPTTISGAGLALSGIGSINSTPSISIGVGGTFNVAGLTATTYNVPGTTFRASGTGTTIESTAAAINGAPGGVVNLGSQAISLTYTPTAFTGDSVHPALYISQGTLNLNGNAISVANAGASALGAGTYVLIQAPSITGTVSSSVTVTGAGVVTGAASAISISGNNVILTVTTPSSPNITSFSISGTQLNVTATGGIPNGPCYVVATTNLSTPAKSWSQVYTTSYDGSGNVSISANVVNTSIPAEFFALQNP